MLIDYGTLKISTVVDACHRLMQTEDYGTLKISTVVDEMPIICADKITGP